MLGLVLRGRPFDEVLVAEVVHSQKATGVGHSRGDAEVRLGWGEARQASGSGN